MASPAPTESPASSMLLGEHFRVRVKNDTDTDTIVHWHGLTPPFGQDGVAMYGQPAIPPGGTPATMTSPTPAPARTGCTRTWACRNSSCSPRR